MLNRSQLANVNNIDLGDQADRMTDEYLLEYEQTANQFIDKVPVFEDNLKDSLESAEFGFFIRNLGEIKEFLDRLYARSLSINCENLMEEVKSNDQVINEAALTFFLTGISMLSIDLQMLLTNPEPEAAEEEKRTVQMENKAPAKPKRAKEPGAETTILAVDDMPLILNNLRMMLAETKYKFVGVPNANAALKYLRENTPDVILLDIEMPGMNGFDLAVRIKEGGIDAPLIFLTGNPARANVIKAVQSGAVDFIVKPVNMRTVLDRVEKHLG
jgi:CheY-like chemotaxis protein